MIPFLIILAVLAFLYLLAKLSRLGKDKTESSTKSSNDSNIEIENLLRRANEKVITKDFKGAVAIADKILLLQPDNYDALMCRGTSLEALNFNLDAIDDFERALQIDNSEANAYGLLGLAYRKVGKVENGQRYLKIAVESGMKLYEPSYNMFLSASDSLKQAFIKRGTIPENLLRRNKSHFIDDLSQVDSEEFEKAVKSQLHILESSISLDPNNKHLKNLYEFVKSQAK